MTPRKALFIGRSTNQWPYHSKLIKSLIENNIETVVYYDKHWSKKGHVHINISDLRKRYPNVKFLYGKLIENWGNSYLINFREFISYCDFILDSNQSNFFQNRQFNYSGIFSKIPKIFILIYLKLFGLGFLRKIQNFWSFIYLKTLSFNIDIETFDFIFVQHENLRYSIDHDIVNYCQKNNLSVFSLNYSWDSLFNKGLLHSKSDVFFCWNEDQKNILIKRHLIDPHKILIVGSLFFERWNDLISDEIIIKRKKIIYAGSSQNIIKNEIEIILSILKIISKINSVNNLDLQFIFRPHPATNHIYKQYDLINKYIEYSTIANDGINVNHENPLKDALCVIGVNTSLFLDALCLDVPIASTIISSSESNINRENTLHFNLLLKNDIIKMLDSENEIKSFILNCLEEKVSNLTNKEKIKKIGLCHKASNHIIEAIDARTFNRRKFSKKL